MELSQFLLLLATVKARALKRGNRDIGKDRAIPPNSQDDDHAAA